MTALKFPFMSNFDKPHLDALRKELEPLPKGPIADVSKFEHLLAEAWEELIISDAGGMTHWKLATRTENLAWENPILTFTIERHGAAALGSIYAELQGWGINVLTGEASCETCGRRRVKQPDSRLDVKPLAEAVAADVSNRRKSPFLQWKSSDRVKVLVSQIIPDHSPKQTVQGRRERLAMALNLAMRLIGWKRVSRGSHYIFERQRQTEENQPKGDHIAVAIEIQGEQHRQES